MEHGLQSTRNSTQDAGPVCHGYKAYNPHTASEDLSAIRRDMETLIQNKLRLFPVVRSQIIGAQIARDEGRDRINVVSARV